MATDKLIIKELEKELRRLRINNLKYKLHMQVLVGSPNSRTAKRVLQEATGNIFDESIINLN